VENRTLFSKKDEGRFPSDDEIVEMLRQLPTRV
jgi:hypothetical protein